MEATALEDSAAMMLPQDAKKKSVGSSKEIPFAEEPKVVYQDQKDNTYIAEDTCSCCASRSQSDNDSSDCPLKPLIQESAILNKDILTWSFASG